MTIGDPLSLERTWPGVARRLPKASQRSYLIHRPLAGALRAAIQEHRRARGGSIGTVVDVGCGPKPYFPWLSDCDRYVGLDIGPLADVQATSEELPLKDACADLVLCTQVLEHASDPARTVAEIARVLRPGGRALVSTHGVQPYHPSPQDYWRWTGSGLLKLFSDDGRFADIRLLPCGGTVACLSYLVALYCSLLGEQLRRRAGLAGAAAGTVLGTVVIGVNVLGRYVDEHLPRQQDYELENTMISNFLVVATR